MTKPIGDYLKAESQFGVVAGVVGIVLFLYVTFNIFGLGIAWWIERLW